MRNQIAADLAKMLNSDVADDAIKQLFRWSYWWWWSGQKRKAGQYLACPYWTERAYEQWKNNPKGSKRFRALRYEHVVPVAELNLLICQLRRQGTCVESSAVKQMLERLCHACVIQKEEDQYLRPKRAMPPMWNADRGDIWARYRNAITDGHITLGTRNDENWIPLNNA